MHAWNRANDRNIHIFMSSALMKKCVKAIEDNGQTNWKLFMLGKDIMQALKKIPQDQGKYIYTRFFKDEVINNNEVSKKLGISPSKGMKLMKQAYKSLCDELLEIELDRSYLKKWSTIENVYSRDGDHEIMRSLSIGNYDKNVESYEILEVDNSLMPIFAKYKLKVNWSKWTRKEEK